MDVFPALNGICNAYICGHAPRTPASIKDCWRESSMGYTNPLPAGGGKLGSPLGRLVLDMVCGPWEYRLVNCGLILKHGAGWHPLSCASFHAFWLNAVFIC